MIQVSDVVEIIADTLELSSMIARTLAQFGPTAVTMPPRPAPAMTLQSTEIPSLEPLSIVKEENQFQFGDIMLSLN